MKSKWLHAKQLLKIFESWKKFKKSIKRDNDTGRNKRKRFCENLETLFDLAAENAEQQISSDYLRTKQARKEDVDFLHDQKMLVKCKCPLWIMSQEQNGKENV